MAHALLSDIEIEKVRTLLLEEEGIDYSAQVIRHWLKPSHLGHMEAPQGYAEISRSCGDGMTLYLRILQERIVAAKFFSQGCICTIAAANMASMLAEGRPVYDAFDIDARAITEALGGLPEGEMHCAEMAGKALHQALRSYLAYRKDSWKRAYRKPG